MVKSLHSELALCSFYRLFHSVMISLASSRKSESNAFWFVSLFVQTRNSKTVALIELIFLTRVSIPVARSSLRDPERDAALESGLKN